MGFIQPLLPPPARTSRPRADDRQTIEGLLLILITWRTLWPTDLPDAPLSVIKPDYDFQMWVPLSEDARLCAALGFPT